MFINFYIFFKFNILSKNNYSLNLLSIRLKTYTKENKIDIIKINFNKYIKFHNNSFKHYYFKQYYNENIKDLGKKW